MVLLNTFVNRDGSWWGKKKLHCDWVKIIDKFNKFHILNPKRKFNVTTKLTNCKTCIIKVGKHKMKYA